MLFCVTVWAALPVIYVIRPAVRPGFYNSLSNWQNQTIFQVLRVKLLISSVCLLCSSPSIIRESYLFAAFPVFTKHSLAYQISSWKSDWEIKQNGSEMNGRGSCSFRVGGVSVERLRADTPAVTPNLSIFPHNWPNENTPRIVFLAWAWCFEWKILVCPPLASPHPCRSFSVTPMYHLLALFASRHHCCHSCSFLYCSQNKDSEQRSCRGNIRGANGGICTANKYVATYTENDLILAKIENIFFRY